MSRGLLLNPEIKRFAIASPLFFKPVRPGAGPGDVAEEKTFIKSSEKLIEAYTGAEKHEGNSRYQAIRKNLANCFANSIKAKTDPEVKCQYYVQGLKREVAN